MQHIIKWVIIYLNIALNTSVIHWTRADSNIQFIRINHKFPNFYIKFYIKTSWIIRISYCHFGSIELKNINIMERKNIEEKILLVNCESFSIFFIIRNLISSITDKKVLYNSKNHPRIHEFEINFSVCSSSKSYW